MARTLDAVMSEQVALPRLSHSTILRGGRGNSDQLSRMAKRDQFKFFESDPEIIRLAAMF